MVIFVIALYVLLKQFDVFSLSSKVESAVGLGTVFIIGLVAATSTCLAVVGGLLLSVSAKWTEVHASESAWDKFRPLFLFNMGRLGGYFVLGGVAGVLGTSLAISPYSTGILTVFISIVMAMLGLNILHILPKKYCRIPLPRSLSERIKRLSTSNNPFAAITLGAMTFFLPCGFTQSMQLLALASGSFLAGGMIMFVFALGTLPALLGISIVSSLVEGRGARWFLQFSGAVVLLLGILNLQNGLFLMGYDPLKAFGPASPTAEAAEDPYVTVDDQGRQIMSMYVTSGGYSPSNFTIRPGLETWVYAIANDGVSGCASFLVDPTHNLQVAVRQGGNWLGPITNPNRDFLLTCSMGMFRANVRVKQS